MDTPENTDFCLNTCCMRNRISKRSTGISVLWNTVFSLVCNRLNSFSNTSCDKGTVADGLFIITSLIHTGTLCDSKNAEYMNRLHFRRQQEHKLWINLQSNPHHKQELCDNAWKNHQLLSLHYSYHYLLPISHESISQSPSPLDLLLST